MNIGILGCGNISGAYFKGLKPFPHLKVLACADINQAAAQAKATEFGIDRVLTPEALIADPEIDLIINLTHPQAHAPVNLQILAAGKHAYCEKPFADKSEAGEAVLAFAKEKGLMVCCAPDTVLGNGIQGARHLIDAGMIGKPISANAFMVSQGPESWHPNPAFYYLKGGGPLWDMGPYYITSLIHLLGKFESVYGHTSQAFKERVIGSEPLKGTIMPVETPTHLLGIAEMEGGIPVHLQFSFDVFGGHKLPQFEIYGTEGTLQIPDPNRFDGDLMLRRRGEKEWAAIENPFQNPEGRGLGIAEMAYSLSRKETSRIDGSIAQHVVDLIECVHRSGETKKVETLSTSCQRPLPMPENIRG